MEHTICSYRSVPISISYASTETEQLHQQDINNIESEGYPRELNNNVNDFLPDESDFRWDEVNGSVFCQKIDRAYEEIVHWNRSYENWQGYINLMLMLILLNALP